MNTFQARTFHIFLRQDFRGTRWDCHMTCCHSYHHGNLHSYCTRTHHTITNAMPTTMTTPTTANGDNAEWNFYHPKIFSLIYKRTTFDIFQPASKLELQEINSLLCVNGEGVVKVGVASLLVINCSCMSGLLMYTTLMIQHFKWSFLHYVIIRSIISVQLLCAHAQIWRPRVDKHGGYQKVSFSVDLELTIKS